MVSLFVATVAAGDIELELRYAARLRERGLFRLAELQCQQLLGRNDLDATTTSRATIELSKSFAEHALNSRPPERQQLWRRAIEVLDDALAHDATDSSRILLETQKALTLLLQGEWSRRVAQVQARDDADGVPARDQLRQAILQLEEVARKLDQPTPRTGPTAVQLSPARRDSLRRHVHYQLARAYRNHALTYPDASNDRVDSLTRALDRLRPLASSQEDDRLMWQSGLDLVGVFRLLKEFGKARQLLVKLPGDGLPAEFEGLLAAEKLRLALAEGNLAEAANLAGDTTSRSAQRAKADPEFQLARIQTLVTRASQAKRKHQTASSQRLTEQATREAASLGRKHGTYWAWRGAMLITQLAEKSEGNGDSDLLSTAAKSYLQDDSPAEAAQMFVQDARRAEQDGDSAGAFRLRYRAAMVDHQSGNLQAAVDRLRDAGLKYPLQPEAPTAHLLAAFDAAALYQQKVERGTGAEAPARALAQYRLLLKEHLAHWPDAETTDQARLWLGRLHEAEGNWKEALVHYQAIAPGSPHSLPRYARLRGVYEKVLTSSDAESTAEVQEARQWFDTQAQSARAVKADPQATRALEEAARLRLFHEPPDYVEADANLQEALSLVDPQTSQARELLALAVVAAAGQNQMRRAQRALDQAVPLSAPTLVEIMRAFQSISDARPDDGNLLGMMAKTAGLLTTYRDQLSERDRRLLAETEADTRQTTNLTQATATYRQLAEAYPDSPRIQRRLAELLSLGKDRQTREAALAQWRTVVRKSRPYGRAWFRAKLGVARAHFHLNDRRRAREIIELLMSLHPDMGDPQLKHEFMTLLERCRT